MSSFWMIRAGEGGRVADDFKQKNVVALNFEGVDLTHAKTKEQIRPLVERVYPDRARGFIPLAAGAWYRFRSVLKPGDAVVTYDPARRIYLLGEIVGEYEFIPSLVPDHEQVRRVRWEGEISRDVLSQSSRNTLGGTLAIFSLEL